MQRVRRQLLTALSAAATVTTTCSSRGRGGSSPLAHLAAAGVPRGLTSSSQGSSSSSSSRGWRGAGATAAAVAAVSVACSSTSSDGGTRAEPGTAGSFVSCLSRRPLLRAAADAAGAGTASPQPRAAWSPSQPEPLSGAIAALDEAGLTNHPLDYDPITNEHTAAMTLSKQAGIEAYQAGRYAEAERWFKEALAHAQLGFPPGDPHIPSAMHYLAELYRNTGQLDKAEPLYRQTIAALSDSLGERHWMFSAALCSMAALHEARREYGQALELLETALQLRRQLFSAGSFLYADTAALLAKTLMAAHNSGAATPAAAGSGAGSSTSSSSTRKTGGWFGWRGGAGSAATAPPAVARAIQLWQQAVHVVEESGSVVDTPVVPWLLDLAAAQQVAQQHTAAVDSLAKALRYMALPSQQGSNGDSKPVEQQQQQQQQQQVDNAGSADSDTLSTVLAAAGGDMSLARLKLAALASEVAERLVDAQLAAGDMQGARVTLTQALEARIALHGRHLVVAKTMTRLANLLMAPPPDPQAPQLAQHFAASAVTIADAALQTAQRANLWGGMLRGALQALSTAQLRGYKAGLEAERSSERLMAALQLGSASLALAAAEQLNDRQPEAQAALSHAVSQLRWVLDVGASDLQRLSGAAVQPAMLQRVAGQLFDLRLLQMDCLEALAASIRRAATDGHQASAGAMAPQPSSGPQAAPTSKTGGSKGGSCQSDTDAVLALLAEAELLAAELCTQTD